MNHYILYVVTFRYNNKTNSLKKITLIAFVLLSVTLFSQEDTSNRQIFTYEIIDGDTIPILKLKEFKYKDPEFEKQWRRTVFFTRRVYPYAKIIDSIVTKYESDVAELKKQKGSKRKIKKYEKKLKKELTEDFKLEIKNMSVTRGEYLAKLTHRETGKTLYDLIKQYKSGTNAFFWQMVMKIYGGANLKAEYDPEKDWMLALVLKEIEEGRIIPISRNYQKQLLIQQEEQKKKKK